MKKKRVMIIGPAGCGKSTLAQALEECEKAVRKTPEVLYGERTIDCPGAYVENRGMYHHLIALAQDASQLVLVMDAARPADVYSHNFAGAFSKPAAGVITKIDLAPQNENFCRERLRRAGVNGPIFCVSIPEGRGVDELKKHLLFPEREMRTRFTSENVSPKHEAPDDD